MAMRGASQAGQYVSMFLLIMRPVLTQIIMVRAECSTIQLSGYLTSGPVLGKEVLQACKHVCIYTNNNIIGLSSPLDSSC